jgi:poly-gamma-glutamate synthesis protein (capsule biosynthesis protein)
MTLHVILAGDVNLMGVKDPSVPFSKIAKELSAADLTFTNLECCLFAPPPGRPDDGYFAPPKAAGEALQQSGIDAVGVANNVNYGTDAIVASLARLKEVGISTVGAGNNRNEARAPLVVEREGCRIGILQRTAVYWPDGHEATATMPGVAAIKGHTIYKTPDPKKSRPGLPPSNRPGLPPEIETAADAESLSIVKDEIKALRSKTDFVIASFHWGLFDDVLTYMTEFAHAAIDAGASIVIGQGPHDHVLPIEFYKGVPIIYNLGALSFQHGPGGKTFHEWIGLLVHLEISSNKISGLTFDFVRQSHDLVISKSPVGAEPDVFEHIAKASAKVGTTLSAEGSSIRVQLPSSGRAS